MGKTSTLNKTVSGSSFEYVTRNNDLTRVIAHLEKLRSEPSQKSVHHIMQFCRSYKVMGKNKMGIMIN